MYISTAHRAALYTLKQEGSNLARGDDDRPHWATWLHEAALAE
jgi:hypothetical protein